VAHTSVLNWVRQVSKRLPDAYDPHEIPQVGEFDELETFVGRKRNTIWIWTVVDHFRPGILGWTIGDHSAEAFKPFWQTAAFWQCFF